MPLRIGGIQLWNYTLPNDVRVLQRGMDPQLCFNLLGLSFVVLASR
jgi:hypothetical protein